MKLGVKAVHPEISDSSAPGLANKFGTPQVSIILLKDKLAHNTAHILIMYRI